MTPAEIVATAFMSLAAMTMDRGPVCTSNDPRGYALIRALILPSCEFTDMSYGRGYQWLNYAGTKIQVCIPRRPA
jgi:hypothetical protein